MIMERIELMLETNQMDRDTYERIPELLREIEAELQLELREENAGACISHLIKAIQRVKANEAVQECSDALMVEAKTDERLFRFSIKLLTPFLVNGTNLEPEAAFIASYFIMMLEEEKESC